MAMVAPVANIFVIDNREGRNEQFLPLFSHLYKSGQGKLEKNYYLVNSNVYMTNGDNISMLFTHIQNQAMRRGFNITMYYL